MLTLRELTQSFLMQPSVFTPLLASLHHSVFSWPVLGVLVALLLLAPSWFVCSTASSARGLIMPVSSSCGSGHELLLAQSIQGCSAAPIYPHAGGGRRWPECNDGHYKSA